MLWCIRAAVWPAQTDVGVKAWDECGSDEVGQPSLVPSPY